MDIRLEPDVVSGNDVLTVTDLSKSFDTQTLFTNVDFEIKRGERVAIIGNNGTGKTTLLKIINGIIPADSGQIRLGSKVHIGYYDQEHQVLQDRYSLRNLLLLHIFLQYLSFCKSPNSVFHQKSRSFSPLDCY